MRQVSTGIVGFDEVSARADLMAAGKLELRVLSINGLNYSKARCRTP